MKKIMNFIKNFREIIVTILAICTVVATAFGFTWTYVCMPKVEKRINYKIDPIIELLTYHSFIFEAQLDSTTANVVLNRYLRWKDGAGKLK